MRSAASHPPDEDIWPVLRDTLSEVRYLGAQILRRSHVSLGQALVLHRICDAEGLRLSALADMFGISRPAASALVSSLEKQGRVRRVRSPTDRRGVIVRLTPRGLDLIATFDREFESVVRSATGPVPRELRVPTVKTLSAVLDEMRTRRERSSRRRARTQ